VLTIKSFPNTSGIRIKTISSEKVFPVMSYTLTDPWLWVFQDGSICQLFEVVGGSAEKTRRKLLSNMPFNSSLQFYAMQKNGCETNYVAIKVGCPINVLQNNIFKSLIVPGSAVRILNTITTETNKVIKRLLEMSEGLKPVDHVKCDLLNHLATYSHSAASKRNTISYQIKANMSVVRVNGERFITVCSIQNPNFEKGTFRLDTEGCLHITTVIRPDKTRNDALLKELDKQNSLTSSILYESRSPQPIGDRGAYYVDEAYCLSGDTVESLSNKEADLKKECRKAGIQLYFHTHSSAEQYLSLFPGNSEHGTHYYCQVGL